MKKFEINCGQCGKMQTVGATQAGSTIQCACGVDLAVPPLSELRTLQGLAAYEMPVSEKVLQLVFDGKLPTHRDCLLCGDTHARKQHLIAVCERSHQQTAGKGAVAGVIMGVPFYLPVENSSTGRRVGRDVVVPVVFNACSRCWLRSLGRTRTPFVFQSLAILLSIIAAASLVIWRVRPDLLETRVATLSAVACVMGALVLCLIGISISTASLERLRKGLCKEPAYRDLFKQYPKAELFELQPTDGAPG